MIIYSSYTAMYIAEKMEQREIGETDVRIMLRKQCTKSPLKWDFPEDFDEKKYKALLQESNLNQ